VAEGRVVGRTGVLAVLIIGLLAACQPGAAERGAPDAPGAAERGAPGGPGAPGSPDAAGAAASPTAGAAATPDRSGPARFAPQVRTHARRAGINPQLLMAILYNESYKPHDPALERAWQKIQPDAAFGIANMHQAAFDEAKRGRDFADRDWQELPDDPDLAIKAAAWHLHDLARQLPARWSGRYTRDELLALGYNAGAGNMKAFARGARPGRVAQSYLDRLRDNWAKAATALR
jgi:pyruvate/2-oxoglutarate dehydrogenase complex dihydrolipoamide acyltransferase (E2) component